MKEWTRGALVALVVLAPGCADGRRADGREVDVPHAPPIAPPARVGASAPVDAPVVIVTVDGVRWQEVFEGTDRTRTAGPAVPAASLTPNLHRLGTERGAFVGAPGRGTIAASGPNFLSLPGYTELLGGRPSACRDNDCSRTRRASLLDEASAAGAKVAAFASWERLDFAATSAPGAFLVSCGQTAEPKTDAWPGWGNYRPDRLTAEAALAYYEAEQPDVFFLGLGDPDEFAHRGDYPGYVASLREADATVGRLLAILDRSGARGRRTHVVVTADHGRAADFRNHGMMPEAARVWMVASGPRFLARGAVASPYERRLADVTPTLRLVLGLPADLSDSAGTEIEELF